MLPQGVVLTASALSEAVAYFLTQDAFSFDVEASYDYRDDPNRNTLSWISLATYGCTIVIPLNHPIGEQTGTTKITAYYKTGQKAGQPYNKTVKTFSDPPEQLDIGVVFRILKPLFASTTIVKSGYDMIYDLISVAKHFGFVPPGPYFDPKIGFWLLDENRFTRGLKEMTELRYEFKYDFENVGKEVESHPFETVAYYSFCDAKFNFFHYLSLKEELKTQKLDSIFDVEMDVLNVLIGMRMAGATVDVKKIEALKERLSKELIVVEMDLYRIAGKKFNINSNQQKQDILFGPKDKGGQGLQPWKLTDGGDKAKKAGFPLTIRHYSTDDSVLESYEGNPVADKLREYGDISKILTTYVGSWLGDAENPPKIVDGKIYARFLQYGTVTGRFSSSKPNLQNIPRSSTELGKLIRSVFIADPGRTLICADYSQIELVVLAHYLEEGALYEGFLQGIDPHTITAAMILGKEPVDVTKDERQYYGKAQPLTSNILTPDGWKKMGDVQVGDNVCIPDGGTAKVTGVFPQGLRDTCLITFSDGSKVKCDWDHLWTVNTRHTQYTLTAKDLVRYGLRTEKGTLKYSVPNLKPVEFSPVNLMLDPYVMGALLGDGSFRGRSVSFTSADEEISSYMECGLPDNLTFTPKAGSSIDYYITGHGRRGPGKPGPLISYLMSSGLWGKSSHGKFIPEEYLKSSVSERYALLRGLMDTDGYKGTGHTSEFCTVSEQLAKDVIFLVRSLGGEAKLVSNSKIAYRISIRTPDCPFYLSRKADKWKPSRNRRRYVVSVDAVGTEECQCIMIDSAAHLYITDDLVPTHNTFNFAIVYGAGPQKIANMAKLSSAKEAKEILIRHEEMFPEIYSFRDGVINYARKRKPEPYIVTLMGRRRRIPNLLSNDKKIRMGAERQTFNSLIQGGAADVMKYAMPRVDALLPDGALIHLTVHDELVVSAPNDLVDKSVKAMYDGMTGPGIQKFLKAPLNIDLHTGPTWVEAKS